MSLPLWLRKLVRGNAGKRNPRAGRRPNLETLEARLAPAVVLTYGGPGTPLDLTETVDAGTHVTISEPTANLLRIDLNGATFDATSTAAARGLTYNAATPGASSTATVDISAVNDVTDLDATLSTANDVLDLGMTNAAGGVGRIDVSAASGSNTVNLNAIALGAGGTAGNLAVTTDALNVTGGSAIDTTAAGSGSGNVTLTAQLGGITLNPGSSIVTTDGALSLTGTGSANHPDGIDAQGATLNAGTAGSIDLAGTGANATGTIDGVYLFGGTTVQAEGAATVSITGTGGSSGVYVNGTFGTPNTQVTTVDGALSITGTGTAGGSTGIFIDAGSLVQASGSGSVSLSGTGSGTSRIDGIFIDGPFTTPTTEVTTAGGDLTISGTANGTGNGNDGIFIDGGALIHAGGTGALSLTGTCGGSGGDGIFIDGTTGSGFSNSPQTQVTTAGGAVSVSGTADVTADRSDGLFVDAGALIQAGGTADVTLTGSISPGTDRNSGIYLDGTFSPGPNTEVAALGGDVVITGTCQSTGILNEGINVDGGTLIQAGGGGSVNLQGQALGDTPAIAFDTGFGTGARVDTGNVSFTGDVIDLGDPNSIASTSATPHAGQLSFGPLSPDRPIILGGSDTAGSLVFSAADESAIVQDPTAGFSQITIGRADGTGQVTVAAGGVRFTAGLTVETPAAGSGGILLDNGIGDPGRTVALVSGGTIGGAAAPAVTAGCLMLQAQTGVGTAPAPLQTAVGSLEATTASGGIFVTNSGDLTIGCSPNGAGVQVTGPSGDISISTGGALTVPAGQTVSSGGAVSLTGGASGAAVAITINGALTGSPVNVNGGDGGDTFNLNPSGGSALTANGGAGSDSFNVTPNAGVAFTIHGNNPAPPASPGDTLNVNLAGTTNPQLTLVQPTPASGFAGTWTFGNRQSIAFDTIETLLPAADLALALSVAPAKPVEGGNLTYSITVTNQGPGSATTLTLTDLVPATTSFVAFRSASFTGYNPATGKATLASLGPNQSATATLVVRANQDGTVTDTASVSASAPDPTPADNTRKLTSAVGELPLQATGQNVNGVAGQSTGLVTVATFTDPDGPGPVGEYSVAVFWGDGGRSSGAAVSVVLSNDGHTFLVRASHTYAQAGNYPVNTYIAHTNGDLGKASASSTAHITAPGPHALPAGGGGQVRPFAASAGLKTAPSAAVLDALFAVLNSGAAAGGGSGSGNVGAATLDLGGTSAAGGTDGGRSAGPGATTPGAAANGGPFTGRSAKVLGKKAPGAALPIDPLDGP